ncbi:SDR family NAD(P)-dependent oxidoreductase [Amycolatopsis sp. A133]|uniref:SDR family NAD(P)-dependent oxidoreductase n=1 Tax=Amycolatopsis sp. A133 TaxID=3064472 RepID=UPI0027E70443|nr:SDR family NAD(P)-dependent oxidoreductase [Amycolatopsis sp. A133]MDQ7808941.1 SDR family NAD(P)-dependent oxidoreductase [Amycolatopsis sp. A133]
MTTTAPLTADTPIGDWVAHPDGGPLIRALLAEAGVDETVLAPVRLLPLRQLVALSQGRLAGDVVDDLVRRANHGVVPAPAAGRTGWRERIVPGRFEGRTVVVTGAASGIGRATASRIAREGGRVVAVDVSADRLAGFAAGFATEAGSPELVAVPADITDEGGVARILAAAGPRIDGLANVAGVVDDFSPAHEVSDELWRRVFAVNVDGTFRLIRAVVPAMLEAGSGAIVNVASEAALRGSAAGIAYTASKHAVVGITRSCAFMYGPHGIRVNAVAPGGVATGMGMHAEPSAFGQGRVGEFLGLIPPIATAEQLAASITFLLADDGVNVNGALLPSDGGWSVQ